jgi:hypothetical protein
MGKVHGGFGAFDMPGKMLAKLSIQISLRISLMVLFPKDFAGYTGPR